jgi:hypothetical protein
VIFVFADDIAKALIGTTVELSVADDALSVVDSGLLTHKKGRFLFKLGEKFIWCKRKTGKIIVLNR